MRRTGRPLLCWLITTRPFPKPFKFLGREQTKRSYRRWLKGFLALVFRAWRMEPDKRSSLAGIRLSQEQSARLQLVWEHRLWDFQISPDVWSGLGVNHQRRRGERRATDSTSEDEVDERIFDGETTHEDDETYLEEEENFESDAEEISEEDEVGGGGGSGTDSSSHEPTSSNRPSGMHAAAAAAELLQLLFELCIAFMTEEFSDG